jgi:hypothetical protein
MIKKDEVHDRINQGQWLPFVVRNDRGKVLLTAWRSLHNVVHEEVEAEACLLRICPTTEMD